MNYPLFPKQNEVAAAAAAVAAPLATLAEVAAQVQPLPNNATHGSVVDDNPAQNATAAAAVQRDAIMAAAEIVDGVVHALTHIANRATDGIIQLGQQVMAAPPSQAFSDRAPSSPASSIDSIRGQFLDGRFVANPFDNNTLDNMYPSDPLDHLEHANSPRPALDYLSSPFPTTSSTQANVGSFSDIGSSPTPSAAAAAASLRASPPSATPTAPPHSRRAVIERLFRSSVAPDTSASHDSMAPATTPTILPDNGATASPVLLRDNEAAAGPSLRNEAAAGPALRNEADAGPTLLRNEAAAASSFFSGNGTPTASTLLDAGAASTATTLPYLVAYGTLVPTPAAQPSGGPSAAGAEVIEISSDSSSESSSGSGDVYPFYIVPSASSSRASGKKRARGTSQPRGCGNPFKKSRRGGDGTL